VFTHPEGTGKPLDATYASKAFSYALEAAGVPHRRVRDLRHTYAFNAAKAGIPLTSLREWLGHADHATTSIYARYCPTEG
jgi:integrase